MKGSSSGFWKENCSSIKVPKLREEGKRERRGKAGYIDGTGRQAKNTS